MKVSLCTRNKEIPALDMYRLVVLTLGTSGGKETATLVLVKRKLGINSALSPYKGLPPPLNSVDHFVQIPSLNVTGWISRPNKQILGSVWIGKDNRKDNR